MTAKEKAEELVDRFREYSHTDFNYSRGGYQVDTQIQNAKQCALIAVDEIIDSSPRFPNDTDWDDCGATHQYYYEAQREAAEIFWQEVKQEIEKL